MRSVVTWGHARDGGCSRAVQDQLKNVQKIQASCGAFAALLSDASVVTWADAQSGGKCAGSAEGCAADQSIKIRICCHCWGRICRHMGALSVKELRQHLPRCSLQGLMRVVIGDLSG